MLKTPTSMQHIGNDSDIVSIRVLTVLPDSINCLVTLARFEQCFFYFAIYFLANRLSI